MAKEIGEITRIVEARPSLDKPQPSYAEMKERMVKVARKQQEMNEQLKYLTMKDSASAEAAILADVQAKWDAKLQAIFTQLEEKINVIDGKVASVTRSGFLPANKARDSMKNVLDELGDENHQQLQALREAAKRFEDQFYAKDSAFSLQSNSTNAKVAL
jgi:hypothetical protein